MIELQNLTRKFNGLTAVDDITFDVQEGEIFGLLGPNGAGKTTTVRILCCLIRPSAGKAFVGGYDVGKDALKIREIVGLLPESPGLYGELSAYRNLEFYAKLYGVPKNKRGENIERFLKMLNLWTRRNDPVETFSKGMQQKLAIVRSMVHEPQVLFLDEPTAALAPESAKVVRDFILELKQERRTIFLCTHNLDEADHLCDRVGVFKTRLLVVDTPGRLRASVFGRKVIFHLRSAVEIVAETVRKLPFGREVKVVENKLVVSLDEPEIRNPDVVRTLVKSGADVQFVGELRHTLEDVYLQLVKSA